MKQRTDWVQFKQIALQTQNPKNPKTPKTQNLKSNKSYPTSEKWKGMNKSKEEGWILISRHKGSLTYNTSS